MSLNEQLKERGIKQKWLAVSLGVSEATVSSWCKGKSSPRHKNMKKISQLLDVPLSILTEDNDKDAKI